VLKLNKVSKFYNNKQILQEVDLTVASNQIIGLAGPSGSGKSTLLRCIQKLTKVDSGHINCDETIGFMFQDFQLFPHMTVLENLIYAPNLHNMKEVHERALLLLTRLGVKDKVNFYPSQLSGGQKQRVSLARILMIEPKLLLCDEPTSGLDIATVNDVAALLSDIKNQLNITMIIASHDLDFLVSIANRVILLKDGTIANDIEVATTNNPIETMRSMY